MKSKGQTIPPVMNKLETRYYKYLDSRPDVLEVYYEPFKLRLGKDWKTTYAPDFLIMKKDLTLEVHETKGFWRDDARVKIKVAANLYPIFKWVGVTLRKGKWWYEEF